MGPVLADAAPSVAAVGDAHSQSPSLALNS